MRFRLTYGNHIREGDGYGQGVNYGYDDGDGRGGGFGGVLGGGIGNGNRRPHLYTMRRTMSQITTGIYPVVSADPDLRVAIQTAALQPLLHLEEL